MPVPPIAAAETAKKSRKKSKADEAGVLEFEISEEAEACVIISYHQLIC